MNILVLLAILLAPQESNPLERFRSRVADVSAEGSKGADGVVKKCKDQMARCIDVVGKSPADADLALLRKFHRDLQDLLRSDDLAKDPRRIKLTELWESIRTTFGPLGSFRLQIEGVPTDSNNPLTDAGVKETKKLFFGVLDASTEDPGHPDWKAVVAAHGEWKKLEESIGNDVRVQDLGTIWTAIEARRDAVIKKEAKLYEDAKLCENAKEDLAALKRASSLFKAERLVRECDYALSVLPKEKSAAWSEVREEGARLLEKARGGESLDRARAEMLEAFGKDYAEALELAVRAKKNTGDSEEDDLHRHADWESARVKWTLALRRFRESTRTFPKLADESIGEQKASELAQRIGALAAEADKEARALEERVDAIAQSRLKTWVKSLTGDKKKLYVSKGAPSLVNAKETEWRYVGPEGAKSTTVTFDGDKLVKTEED